MKASKVRKKPRLKKVYLLFLTGVVVALILILLLFYEPAGYRPLRTADSNEVSRYLTHVLSPQLYNGVQRGESFELIVSQSGVNEMISHGKWPKKSDGVEFSAPWAFFVQGQILLMGSVRFDGTELVVSVVGNAFVDEQGLLNLRVSKVKIGALNVTFFARLIAARIYQKKRAEAGEGVESVDAKIAASLVYNEPFEAVFAIPGDDKKVRIEKIAVEDDKLRLRVIGVSE